MTRTNGAPPRPVDSNQDSLQQPVATDVRGIPAPTAPAEMRVLIAVACSAFVFFVTLLLAGQVLRPSLAGNPLVVLGGAMAATIGVAVTLLRPRWVLPGLLLAVQLAHDFLEETSLPLGFMKFYIMDAVFVFNIALIAGRILVGRARLWPTATNRAVAAYFAIGVWGVFNGLILSKNPFDEVLGDFRRAYFYFLNFFVILLLTDGLGDVRRLRKVLVFGAICISVKAFFQAATGQFYYRRAGDAAHVLSQYEIVFLAFGVYYALGQILYNPRAHRLWWGMVAGAGMLAAILGNYRASWLGVMCGLAVIFLVLPARRKWRFALTGVLVAAFVALAFAFVWDVQVTEGRTTVGEQVLKKASVGNTTEDVNVIWRFESYKAAIERWLTRPLTGSGLGTYLSFYVPTSTGGSMLAEGHSIHNSMLWLLMTQGIVGFLVILNMHVRIVRESLRYLRTSEWQEGRVTVLACTAFYAAMMVSTCFENFLEGATAVTLLSSTVALGMMTIRFTPDSAGVSPDGVQGRK